MRKRLRLPILCMLAVLGLAGNPARASLILSFTAMIPPAGVNYPAPQPMTVMQFNPVFGTLNFVFVRISAIFDVNIRAENLSGTPANITALATETVTVTPPPFIWPAPIAGTTALPLTTHPVQAFDGNFDYAGPSATSFSLSPNPQTQLMANLIYDPVDPGFGNFIGVGFLPNFLVNGTGEFLVIANTGLVEVSANLRAGAKLEIDYIYEPEPATLGLLAVGATLLRPRRRSRRA